ncbi:hypothetical protein ACQY0O_002552 [Thecaphora frezii]
MSLDTSPAPCLPLGWVDPRAALPYFYLAAQHSASSSSRLALNHSQPPFDYSYAASASSSFSDALSDPGVRSGEIDWPSIFALIRLLPAGIVALRATVYFASNSGRSRRGAAPLSKRKRGQGADHGPLSRLVRCFDPFVTQQDVDAFRREREASITAGVAAEPSAKAAGKRRSVDDRPDGRRVSFRVPSGSSSSVSGRSGHSSLSGRDVGTDPFSPDAFDPDRFAGFRRQRRRIARLVAVAAVEAVSWMVQLGWQIGSSEDAVGLFHPFTTLCLGLGWSYVIFALARCRPQTPPPAILAVLLSLALSAAVGLFSWIPTLAAALRRGNLGAVPLVSLAWSLVDLVLSAYAIRQILLMPIAPGGFEAQVGLEERLRIQSGKAIDDPSGERPLAETYRLCPTSPEDYCSLYENLSYSWMAPIQKLALQRSLAPTDVWRLRSINDTRLLFRKFQALDRDCGSDSNSTPTKPRRSLLAKVLRANANDVLLDACFKLISVSFAYLGTFIMKSILTEIQLAAALDDDGQDLDGRNEEAAEASAWTPRQRAFVYAVIGLALTVVRFLAELQNYHHARQVGLRLRSTLVVSLFEKALKRRDLSGLTRTAKSDRSGNAQEPAMSASASASPIISQGSPDPSSNSGDSDPIAGDETEATAVDGGGRDQRSCLAVPDEARDRRSEADQNRLARKRSWANSLRSLTVKSRASLSSLNLSWLSTRSAQRSKRSEERRRAAELQRMEERGADVGKVVNMMASDVNVLLRMGCDLHQLYGAPFEVTIATIFLYKLMGWSSLVGFSILVAAIPVNYYWGETAVAKQRQYSSARDERMNLMTELVGAMRFVKIQGVDGRWEEQVREARRREIRKLIWSRVMTFLFELMWTAVPVLVTLISFFCYVKVAKEELTVAVAFTAIALFTMIRPPLNAIPGFLMGGFIALVSIKRLEAFLNEDEVDQAVSALSRGRRGRGDDDDDDDGDGSDNGGERKAAESAGPVATSATAPDSDRDADSILSIDRGSFRWHVAADAGDAVAASVDVPFELRDLTVTFPPRKLTVVLGPTGSGKSSLLAALLGEMLETSDGAVRRSKFDKQNRSRISFAAQLPWLEAGKTVRENITFITPFEPERYRLCLHACALEDDIAGMEDGDMTQIGAHTVSGGQKARIALARALYAKTETVLLDDVLSAVDTRVQNHIVKHALTGEIARGRRIVLVTHHAHLLADKAKQMVYMRRGRIEALGSPDKLRKLGLVAGHDGRSSSGTGPSDSAPKAANGEGGAADEAGKAAPARYHATPGTRTPRVLYEAEKRRQGAVSWIFYKTYLRASKRSIWLFLIVFLLLMRLASSFEQYWLKVWGEAYRPPAATPSDGTSATDIRLPPASGHSTFYLGVYGLAGFAVILFNSARSICFYTASIRASQNLFTSLLSNVIGAPLRWFDINPTGRILNRFGTDMDGVDNVLPQAIMNFLGNAFAISTYFLICVVIVPSFVVPSLLLLALGPWLVGGFLAAARDMQRIEATSTSPLYGHFQQALTGIMTIRAFGAEPRMLESLLDAVDLYQSLWWAVCTMEVWLSFRSQILGGVAVFVVTLLALSGAVSPGSAGLALSSAQLLCQLAYYLVNDFKNISTSFNSLERVAEYQTMRREETNEIVARYQPSLPPAGWPSRGATIVFDDVSLRYAPELPEVLKGVSFEIRAGEKVGVIGRTGSGKSSLASSLFRATELSGGRIVIDGIDISTIRLRDLRSRLSIVMQDPVLFSGTLRDNLDPFNEYSDDEILDAMGKINIAARRGDDEEEGEEDGKQPREATASAMQLTLDTPVSSGGANFSAGQAQLISLARSLLRRSRILILDEATSSTDMATDAVIQTAIRTQLSDCIVVCVAHRLRSVIDYDRILVMHQGTVVEFGTPKELLQKEDGEGKAFFHELCRQSAEYGALRAAVGL